MVLALGQYFFALDFTPGACWANIWLHAVGKVWFILMHIQSEG